MSFIVSRGAAVQHVDLLVNFMHAMRPCAGTASSLVPRRRDRSKP